MLFLKKKITAYLLINNSVCNFAVLNGSSNSDCLMKRSKIEASFILMMEHLKSMVRYRGEVSFFSLSSGGFKFND